MTLYERCVRGALRAYKLTLSPLIGRQCRFVPTCSEYAADALIGHGLVRGGVLSPLAGCAVVIPGAAVRVSTRSRPAHEALRTERRAQVDL